MKSKETKNDLLVSFFMRLFCVTVILLHKEIMLLI